MSGDVEALAEVLEQTRWHRMTADSLAAVLLASDWMKRHDAEVRAEAWERGNNDGLTFAAAPQKSLLTNPYRADREQP